MVDLKNEDLIRNIEALRTGDKDAFARIYQCCSPKLYGFARKLIPHSEEAEEIVQEVFVKLWERRHLLDPKQNFDGYLFRMARNLVYNRARHQVHAFAYCRYLAGKDKSGENETEVRMDYQELNLLLEEAYAALPPMRRQAFLMSRMEGRSVGEIAQAMQTSKSNIENHINKALREIRIKLKRNRIIYLVLFYCYPF